MIIFEEGILMVDSKTKRIWLSCLFAYCYLMGFIDPSGQNMTNSGLVMGRAIGMFGMGGVVALIAAIINLFKKEKTKLVFIVWTISTFIVSLLGTGLVEPKNYF